MNKKRLIKAYEILKTIPGKNVDLSRWRSNQSFKDFKPTCNTIACAGGWLAMHPNFRKKGLSTNVNGTPIYEGQVGYRALAEFFGIEPYTSMNLFMVKEVTEKLSDKRTVLRRFERFFDEEGIVV